jgi:CheY-like chemotaxis protein
VFLNLGLNAIQAMPDGGHLRIASSRYRLPEDFFLPGEEPRDGEYLCLVVADTGEGMDEGTLERLFEPFFTTKKNGTGLGLLSCKRIVASHGGVMRVESRPGEGTRFQLYIPLTELRDDAAAQELDGDSFEGNAERVLVVVEEAAQLSLLSDMLDAYGYQVHTSQSGTAALQWIESHGVPEAVVMDAEMNLFTGVRTLAALVDHGYNGPVLLLARPDAPPNLDELPALDHLYVVNKPVTTRVLLLSLRKALGSNEAA